MKNILKAWLRKNELTPDPNDMIAVVSPAGKINKSGLIDAIMDEGIELKRETVEGAKGGRREGNLERVSFLRRKEVEGAKAGRGAPACAPEARKVENPKIRKKLCETFVFLVSLWLKNYRNLF